MPAFAGEQPFYSWADTWNRSTLFLKNSAQTAAAYMMQLNNLSAMQKYCLAAAAGLTTMGIVFLVKNSKQQKTLEQPIQKPAAPASVKYVSMAKPVNVKKLIPVSAEEHKVLAELREALDRDFKMLKAAIEQKKYNIKDLQVARIYYNYALLNKIKEVEFLKNNRILLSDIYDFKRKPINNLERIQNIKRLLIALKKMLNERLFQSKIESVD